jgi:hypothetical protein
MVRFFSRRRARGRFALSRAAVETLEGRTFFDVATFSVTDPSVGQSYGVNNT